MPQIEYTPLGYQKEFHDSMSPKVYLSAGFGAGKTYALVMKLFQLMNLNRGLPGGLLCPDLKMYKRDVLPTIRDISSASGIKYKYNKSDFVFFFPQTGSTLYVFHSTDEGKSIRGPNLAFMLMNEITLIDKETFNAAISRVRIKEAKQLQIAMSGTPEGFNWVYEYFIENPRGDTDMIYGDSRQNTHVADSYITMLETSYDDLMRQQYVEGKFINLGGKRCAYAFDRRRHTSNDIERIDGYPVWVSIDFNVAPMSATLWNRMPFGHNNYGGITSLHELRAFDEICLDSSNTYELCEALKEKIGTITDDVILFPDPAGTARSTKSRGLSDIDILKQNGFKNIRYKNQINVRNAINATNAMLQKDRIILNSKKCKNAIADLEQCIFKNDRFEIDKSNPKRTHWLDGLKNMIELEFPIAVGRGMTVKRWL